MHSFFKSTTNMLIQDGKQQQNTDNLLNHAQSPRGCHDFKGKLHAQTQNFEQTL